MDDVSVMVGVAGFEPTASPTPRVRATRLRHTPTESNIRNYIQINTRCKETYKERKAE